MPRQHNTKKRAGAAATEKKLDFGDWLAWGLVIICGAVLITVGYYAVRWGRVVWRATDYVISTVEHNRSLPNPVKIQDGKYHFPLQGRLFVVPTEYVRGYGRASTDGHVGAITLHMLLPDLVGHSAVNDAQFRSYNNSQMLIEVVLNAKGDSRAFFEKRWYEFSYSGTKEGNGGRATIISETPHVEHTLSPSSDYYYYFSGEQAVSRIVYCNRLDIDRDIIIYPQCKMNVIYSDGINFDIWYARQDDPAADLVHLADNVIQLLRSFEQSEPQTSTPSPQDNTP